MGLDGSLLLTLSLLSTALEPKERKRQKETDRINIEPEEGERGRQNLVMLDQKHTEAVG